MKKLICAKDVETAHNQGEQIIYIEKNTIITPSAQDMAVNLGIEFSTERPGLTFNSPINTRGAEGLRANGNGLDSEMIYNLLKLMGEKGLLNGLLDSLVNPKPYSYESASNGLKVVRGNSIKLDPFETGDPNSKVYCQEIISKEESSMSAGILTIDNSKFKRETSYEEINYLIEGNLEITIEGKTLTANSGDTVYIPSGSKITYGSSNQSKILYVTYPNRNLPKKDFVLS